MAYVPVAIYDLDGNFLGYSIKNETVDKLHNTNLWRASDQQDLADQLKRLNQAVDIRAFWPDMRDPEVLALIENPDWEPLKLSPVEVVDEENSDFVWIVEPDETQPGQMDVENSTIVHKYVDAPAPADYAARLKKACEVVARQRAGAYV
jgi:hypothetical protein